MHRFTERNVVIPKGQRADIDLSNNTEKIFQKRYQKRLFLEPENKPIRLCDVYIEPRLVDKTLNEKKPIKRENIEKRLEDDNYATKYIKKFVENFKDKVLFIEGVAGAGKSSLLSKMSTLLYGKDIFYKSLKDYLSIETIQLKKEINKTFSLTDNDYDKIFFLDGLDEIWNKIDLNEFEDDLRFFIERNHKVIFTLRPGYVPYYLYKNEIKLCVLEPFGVYEKKEWIKKYKQLRKDNLDDGVIKNVLANTKFVEITNIPIILYIIANRNINIDSIRNIPQLYERVFDSLKEDKGNRTKKKLEKDYKSAQRIAYLMQKKGILTITKSELISEMEVDESFCSSVYMEKIIEGEEILEFVHKSIQEFFAAKWIYNQISCGEDNQLFMVLSEHLFSKEILVNLQFFLNYVGDIIGEKFSNLVCDEFPYYGTEQCCWSLYKRYTENILINTIQIYTQIMHGDLVISNCKNMWPFFEVIGNVNVRLNKENEIKNMRFNNCFLSQIAINNFCFYNIIFDHSEFDNCIFEHTIFFQCTFIFNSMKNGIIFRRCQFNNATFLVGDNNIEFEECTFVLYDSKLAEKTAIEIQKCNLDKESLDNLKKM